MRLLLVTLGLPLLASAGVVEHRKQLPRAWKQSTIPLDLSSTFELHLGLAQQNIDQLEAELLKVSDPTSPTYGHHWSAEQVQDFFTPSKASVTAVRNWLNVELGHNNTVLSSNGAWLAVNLTIGQANQLLSTRYVGVTHTASKRTVPACNSYSVPDEIRSHIDIIQPTLHFAYPNSAPAKIKPQPAASNDQAGSVILTDYSRCNRSMTPECLKTLYNFKNYKPSSPGPATSIAVSEYSPQTYADADLDKFFKSFAPNIVQTRPVFVGIAGGTVSTNNYTSDYVNIESTLDLSYAMALVDPLPVTLLQIGTEQNQATFNTMLDALDGSYCTSGGGDDYSQGDPLYANPECGTVTPPAVMSTSYSFDEADGTPAYLIRQCNEYGKLGMMGTTFLFSSGDNGVAAQDGTCFQPGTITSAPPKMRFQTFVPSFPGSCPYVTSVGATQLKQGSLVNSSNPESAAYSVIYSGGGFSNVFAKPTWQKDAQAKYFLTNDPGYTSAQTSGSTQNYRGYPDISANGAFYIIPLNGTFYNVFGTSASTPTLGAILTLVNDARKIAKKPSIGYINPTIYTPTFMNAMNDITNGSNPGCNTNGFTAGVGWDPVTGVGTPNFEALKALWVALPYTAPTKGSRKRKVTILPSL